MTMLWDDIAKVRLLPCNFTVGSVTRPPMGLVLHVMEGKIESAWNWGSNPASEVSPHFATAKDGRFEQWVDLDNKAWCQSGGNTAWISVENEGYAGEQYSPQQVESISQLFAKIVRTWPSVPMVATDSISSPGLGWHGMGGSNWGGHPGCPGEPMKAQRGAILGRAAEINGGTPPVPTPIPPGGSLGAFPLPSSDCYGNPSGVPNGNIYVHNGTKSSTDRSNVSRIQTRLMALGFQLPRYGADGNFGPETKTACQGFQNSVGEKADGLVGPKTWGAM